MQFSLVCMCVRACESVFQLEVPLSQGSSFACHMNLFSLHVMLSAATQHKYETEIMLPLQKSVKDMLFNGI
jgi:hypothetical protein